MKDTVPKLNTGVQALASGYTHKGLCIRVMERRDIENARLLHNEESVIEQLTDIHLVSEVEQEEWFCSMSKSKSSRRFIIEELETKDFVGVFRLDRLDLKNRNAMVGLDIVKEKRGQGYAKKIYDWAFRYLFDGLGLHRLGLETLETNTIAISLYEALGFQREGRSRDAIWRNGKYIDLVLYGLVKCK